MNQGAFGIGGATVALVKDLKKSLFVRVNFSAIAALALPVQAAMVNVENFESYSSSAQLTAVWSVAAGSPVIGLETNTVCQGTQAMRFDYSATSAPSTNLVLMTFNANQNWSSDTVFTFTCGGTSNSSDTIIFQLLDQFGNVLETYQVAGGTLNPPCKVVTVDISNGSNFTDAVNGTGLQSVRSIALGVVTTGAGDAGTVYFDNLMVGNRGVLSIFGSSVAAGGMAYGAYSNLSINGSLLGGYGAQLTALEATNGWWVENQSRFGDTTAGLIGRFYTDEVPTGADEDLIALSLGNEGLPGTTNPQAICNQFLKGITNLIAMSRSNNISPLLGGQYPRDAYTASDYVYLKNMDLQINTLNVPSVNFLGATDDGSGHWVNNSFINLDAGDTVHPNTAGQYEMFLTIVPSVFDALKAGILTPRWGAKASFLRIAADPNQSAPLSFTPSLPMHSFTLSFRVRSTGTGTVASITLPASSVHPTVEITATGLAYLGTNGVVNNSGVIATNGAWHDVVIAHQYAGGLTKFYVDGVLAGTVSERLTPVGFVLGGCGSAVTRPGSPAQADYENWLVHRSMLDTEEVTAQFQGAFQQASLEIFAPLDDAVFVQGGVAANRAQSLSTAQINGSSAYYSATPSPASPSNLMAFLNSSSAIKLKWTDPATSAEDAYFVESLAASGQWTNIATLPAHATNYTDTSVGLNTNFQYRVSYSQGALRSDYATVMTIKVHQPPVANNVSTNRLSDTPITILTSSLLADAVTTDGSPLAFGSFSSLPAGVITNDTSITLPGTNTPQTFSYTIDDGNGGSATANVVVGVTSVGSAQMTIPSSGVVNIKFFGIPTINYVVQVTTNLAGPWWPVSTNTAGSDGSWQFSDPNATNAQGFYRTVQP